MNDLIDKWDNILPHSFYYNHLNENQRNEITKKINEFYFGNETFPDTKNKAKSLIDVRFFFISVFFFMEKSIFNFLNIHPICRCGQMVGLLDCLKA